MRTFLLTTLLCILQTTLMAQSKVQLSGRITDSNGNPAAYVTVGVESTTQGTYTNDNGFYTLQLAPGRYKIAVSSVGYKLQQIEINLKADRKQDFVLEESSVNLDGVQVYGKSQAQQLREGSFAVNVLQIGDILQNTSANLNNIIGRTTSVHIREEGGIGSDFDLSINGMSGNSVRYFLDGMPLDTKGSGVSLSNLPTNIIDQVEIYKGVIPAHLGTDALGGAINIITKQDKKNYLDASYSIGSFHTHKVSLNAQFIESKTGLIIKPILGINYSKNDYTMKGVDVWSESADAYVPANRKRFHDDYFSLLGQIEVGFANKPWADAFFVSGSYSKVNKELQTGSVQSRVYGMAERESDAWNISARYKKNNFLLKDLLLHASLSYTWDHSLTTDTAYRKYNWDGEYITSNRNEITGRGRSIRHYKRPLTVINANLDYKLNQHHSLNLNYQFNRTGNDRYDEVDDTFESANDIVTKHILGLSYSQSLFNEKMENIFFIKDYINQPNIRQTDIPSVTGSRDVQGSTTKKYFGYGVGLRYTIMEPLSLKASYEHSVRLPLARELLGNGSTIYANVALKPENSNNVNITLFGTWHPASGHTLYYEASGFIRNVDNYIKARVSETEGMMQYENVPAVHIKGVEGEVRYDWQNRLQLSANLSYQDARDQEKYQDNGKPSPTYDNRVPNRPWLFGSAEAGYTLRNIVLPESRLRLGCTYQWVYWYFLTWEAYGARENKARIPSQHICNADITYSWKNGRYNIALECNNFLDKLAYDNYKLQKPGRAFFAKFRLFIN
ncbi:TonB-dependent receptor [Bacteroides sp. 51]|uniref:TonB-dependent receptor n=1 Tax=Bacteroides sp. 51 TaxID=2302938 RepID=UPI0013D792D4|nr:TonB-dependent receptor [Bacteroides sp. 51]NDV81997.1 TonB-dependent receptor [Bacteroides sp. 51]